MKNFFSPEIIKKFIHKNKTAVLLVLFLFGVLLLVGLFSEREDQKDFITNSTRGSKKAPYLEAKRLLRGEFVHSVKDVYGKIAASQSEIGFRISGVIKNLLVDRGDKVLAGDLLAKLDDTELFLVLKEKEIKLKAAQIEQKKAEKIHNDNRTKNESGYITSSKLEDYAFDVELKKSAFEEAEINLRMARLNLEKTNLKAPFDAVVIERKAQAGENIKAGEAAFVLMDVSRIYADIEISQEDSVNIKKGQSVILRSGEAVFSGTIEAVIPALLGRAMVLTARVIFAKSDNAPLPGTFVSGEITLNKQQDVFAVGVEYIFQDKNGFYLWQYRDDCTLGRVYVTLGYAGDDVVVVETGVVEGMIIVTSKDIALSDNMQANINMKQ